ncbi:hypothetical protein [Streptomyces sp. JJ36]|uniref:hypothetical protein n=1 Tax=Streptomyces sp. JJ36 TaxID=2736645 RepID=UPI001F18CF42|nr:hypothetical protein [Streptomyces sp. JJ36]MCF6526398.1 hypothetical protein [Streptomyces sp. JJ36]
MVTYQELSDLRLGKLKAAATDWETMVGKLEKIADGGDGGASAASLERKANGADWKGRNATVTKQFVTTTAKEFDDVVIAARSVHIILEGAHAKLKQCKEDLQTAVDKAAKKNIYVNDKGGVIASVPPPHVVGDGKVHEPTQQELDDAAAEIRGILDRAAEADSTAAAALRFHAKDKYDFRSQGFESFDGAQQVIADSDAFVKLAEKDPSELTNAELQRLNDLAAEHGKNPVFAERVATGLGAKGTLEFFADAVDLEAWSPQANTSPDDRERRMELLGALEKNLGITLGTATHSGSDAMDAWKKNVIELGGQNVADYGGDAGRPRIAGFQAMSNLMRHGTYESGFLNDYGDALVAYEKEHTGDVRDPGPGGRTRENVLPWNQMPSYSKIDQIHFGADNDGGTDPMTGFMKALSHNPDAATDFFSSGEPQDNSQWVLKDRPSFNDVVQGSMGYGEDADDYEGPLAVNEATGAALVAGATGMDPHDEMAQYVKHDAGHRQVLENSLTHLSARGDDFPPEMRDDMAKVLINHGGVVHQTMGAAGGDTPLDATQLMEVSKQVSRDQDAYGMLNEGMNYAMVEDFHTEKDNPEDSLDRAGRTVGFLEEARYQAIGDRTGEELEEVGWKKNWAYHGLGSAANFIPGVGDVAQRGVDLVATDWMMNEQDRINERATGDYQETYGQRQEHLDKLAEVWYDANADWAENETGYSRDQGIYSKIDASANDGNDRAEGLAGDQ